MTEKREALADWAAPYTVEELAEGRRVLSDKRPAAEYILALERERDALRVWHDEVISRKVVDAVELGIACGVLRRANGRVIELQDGIDELERYSVKAILRPEPCTAIAKHKESSNE